MEQGRDPDAPRGRPLALDSAAESASDSLPAFLAHPDGAPVYHGFVGLEGVEVDGFRLGVITELGVEDGMLGDAFVVAPDGSRAGLVALLAGARWRWGRARTSAG